MASPVHQFEIQRWIEIPLGSFDASFTNSAFAMLLAATGSIAFLTMAMKNRAVVPGRLQMTAELLYEFVAKMVKGNIGHKGLHYLPFVFTLFVFVLMGNLLGLIPYMFTFTSHLIVTAGLALMVFITVFAFGLYNHGLHFFSLFLPPNVPWWLIPFIIPIEIVSYFVRPLTHSVRLFANMMAGHIVLKVVASFAVAAAGMGALWTVLGVLPVFVNTAMMLFELLVAFVQAYVFAILACVYLKDSVDLHH